MYHSMELRGNKWYCVDENVLSDYCNDESRCENQCYCNYSDDCVVCLVGNGDLDHDHADHQVVDYHEIDGVPTSEPCPGIEECLDCRFVAEQMEAV